jgi:hypothetical protein
MGKDFFKKVYREKRYWGVTRPFCLPDKSFLFQIEGKEGTGSTKGTGTGYRVTGTAGTGRVPGSWAGIMARIHARAKAKKSDEAEQVRTPTPQKKIAFGSGAGFAKPVYYLTTVLI